ncbi:metallophosphoesterase family protein [Amphritea balenae]|uniref:Metallophosphoesterase n=1 Tax=Amphritea balenae TaxID=452629 RepID=A0A3P1STH5_9GAMM|nr:metallophosphoesterase family protein [Amphritea balenae]RRD00215.1 metallophosphoesterase [Amphritea balenae]GGK77646.1 hypothetical protein GCM10007941_29710 [Amphritea balenae]
MGHFEPDQNKPLLIFGGAYSNLQATQSLRQIATKLQIPAGNVLCTGDLVAYCAQPDETVDFIRDWDIAVVAGNCEESIGASAEDCGCGFSEGTTCDLLSAQWYNYTLPRVSDDNKTWMRQLPASISFDYLGYTFTAIHGGVEQSNQFVFDSDSVTLKQRQLETAQSEVIIAGHCGIPFGNRTKQGLWLNAGVIGMPANDGNTSTWYMLISRQSKQLKISWHQLSYDHNQTADEMHKAGLNNGYMQALGNGIWPSHDVLPDEEQNRTGKQIKLPAIHLAIK